MSKTGMWGVIVLIVVLAVGAFWYLNQQPATPATQQATDNTSVQPVAPAAPATTQPAAQAAPAASDTSDASLNADLNSADTQIQDANSAGASANSFTDTPVQQTE